MEKTFIIQLTISGFRDPKRNFKLRGIVVADNATDAKAAAIYTAKQWMKESHSLEVSVTVDSCINTNAADFFIDSDKVKKWKQQRIKN